MEADVNARAFTGKHHQDAMYVCDLHQTVDLGLEVYQTQTSEYVVWMR